MSDVIEETIKKPKDVELSDEVWLSVVDAARKEAASKTDNTPDIDETALPAETGHAFAEMRKQIAQQQTDLASQQLLINSGETKLNKAKAEHKAEILALDESKLAASGEFEKLYDDTKPTIALLQKENAEGALRYERLVEGIKTGLDLSIAKMVDGTSPLEMRASAEGLSSAVLKAAEALRAGAPRAVQNQQIVSSSNKSSQQKTTVLELNM